MIEQLMSSSLSGGYEGCAAGLIWLHVRGLHSLPSRIARGSSAIWRRKHRYLRINSISVAAFAFDPKPKAILLLGVTN